MTRQFQFLPIATVTVDDDGNASLELDWSSSAQGEWDEERAEYIESDIASEPMREAIERVCALLDVYVKAQPESVSIGHVCLPS